MSKVLKFPERFKPKTPRRRFEYIRREVGSSDPTMYADLYEYAFAFTAYENAGHVAIRLTRKSTEAQREFIVKIPPLPGEYSSGISNGLKEAIRKVHKFTSEEASVGTDFGNEPFVEECMEGIAEWREAVKAQANPMKAHQWLRTVKPELYQQERRERWWERTTDKSKRQSHADWADSIQHAVGLVSRDLNLEVSESSCKRAWNYRIPESRERAGKLIREKCPRIAKRAVTTRERTSLD